MGAPWHLEHKSRRCRVERTGAGSQPRAQRPREESQAHRKGAKGRLPGMGVEFVVRVLRDAQGAPSVRDEHEGHLGGWGQGGGQRATRQHLPGGVHPAPRVVLPQLPPHVWQCLQQHVRGTGAGSMPPAYRTRLAHATDSDKVPGRVWTGSKGEQEHKRTRHNKGERENAGN